MSKEDNSMFYQMIGNSIQENKDKIEKLEKQNARLRVENQQLKEKINKAKIYMRDNMSLREYENHYMNLMLILKGDSNEK